MIVSHLQLYDAIQSYVLLMSDSSDQEGIEYRLQRDSNMDQFHDLDGKHLFRIDSIIIAIQSVESHRCQRKSS